MLELESPENGTPLHSMFYVHIVVDIFGLSATKKERLKSKLFAYYYYTKEHKSNKSNEKKNNNICI